MSGVQSVDILHDEGYGLKEGMVLRSGIATFRSQFANGFGHKSAPPGSLQDELFLKSIDLPNCYRGASESPLKRFMCIPENELPKEGNPSAAVLVRDVKAKFFKSLINDWRQEPPYAYRGYAVEPFMDEVHNDVEKQFLFAHEKDLEKYLYNVKENVHPELPESHEAIVKGVEAHKRLKEYVRNDMLYYVLVHADRAPEDSDDPEENSEYVCLFALGVSPNSGSWVGVYCTQACHNLCD